MYKLIPQLLVVVSIFTIILIVLRRLPQVTVVEDEPNIGEKQGSADGSGRKFLESVAAAAVRLIGLVLHYAKAAKEQTVKVNYLERFSKALRLGAMRPMLKPDIKTIPPQEQIGQQAMPKAGADLVERRLIEKIQRNPSDQKAYEDLGKLYLERKKFRDAEEVYEFLTRNHDTEDAYFSKLGTVYYNLKKYEQAAIAYNRAIELRKDLPNRHVNLSLCYEALGDFQKAAAAVRRALELSPDNTVYLSLLADFLIRSEDKREAQEVLEKLLELDPSDNSARARLVGLKF